MIEPLVECSEEWKRGWRAAKANVAAAIGCDVHIWKGELWADKIIALQKRADELTSAEAQVAVLRDKLDVCMDCFEQLAEHEIVAGIDKVLTQTAETASRYKARVLLDAADRLGGLDMDFAEQVLRDMADSAEREAQR